jgi:uncharacterized protein (DUF362 family)/NAD-dependent dihydropyrimidine dehydrogenase PreA subunit
MTREAQEANQTSRARIALVRCGSYKLEEVRRAVRRGIELLGGPERFARRDERILFKPNVLAGDPPARATTTHPAVLRAAADVFRSVTSRLSYGDSPGFGKPAFHLRTSGLARAAAAAGVTPADFENGREVGYKHSGREWRFTLAKGVLEADGIISLPKFKTHQLTRITGPVKNQLGCVPGLLKPQYHVRYPGADAFARMLTALNLLIKPRLYILDGVTAMEGNGPRSGRAVHLGLMMFSEDPVAMEVLMCRLIGLDPRFVPTIAAGEELGLGTGRWEEIEILGDDWREAVNPKFQVVREPITSVRQGEAIRFAMNLVMPRPVIAAGSCTRCGTCVEACPVEPKALSWPGSDRTRPPCYDYRRCIRCYCCQEMCPERAISVRVPLLGRVIKVKAD